MSLTSKIVAGVLGSGIGFGSYFVLIKPLTEGAEFNRGYENALIQYADTNKDGFISAAERDAFDLDLLRVKNESLICNRMPRYRNGDKVPMATVTEWIENYKPSE